MGLSAACLNGFFYSCYSRRPLMVREIVFAGRGSNPQQRRCYPTGLTVNLSIWEFCLTLVPLEKTPDMH